MRKGPYSVVIVHPFAVDGKNAKGGVELLIAEFLSYSSDRYLLVTPWRGPTLKWGTRFRAGVDTLSVPSKSTIDFVLQLVWLRLFGELRRKQIQIEGIHVHYFLFAPILRWLFKVKKYVLFVHNNFAPSFSNSGFFYGRLKRFVLSQIQTSEYSRADQIVGFSPLPEASEKPQFLRANFWVDDVNLPTLVPRERRSGILWVGRLEPVKNPMLAIRVVEELSGDQKVNFHFVGSGSLEGPLRSEVSRLGLEDTIAFWGHLSHREALARIGEASVLLVTSISETGPKVALEALALGTAVVATPGADPNGLIAREGYLAENETPNALAQKVRDALADFSQAPRKQQYSNSARVLVPELEHRLSVTSSG